MQRYWFYRGIFAKHGAGIPFHRSRLVDFVNNPINITFFVLSISNTFIPTDNSPICKVITCLCWRFQKFYCVLWTDSIYSCHDTCINVTPLHFHIYKKTKDVFKTECTVQVSKGSWQPADTSRCHWSAPLADKFTLPQHCQKTTGGIFPPLIKVGG